MYNKVVTTLLIFLALVAISGAGHAQYYSTRYSGAVPYSYGYANSYYQGADSSAGFRYFGERRGPVFMPTPTTPSVFTAAYQGTNFAPVFQAAPTTPSNINLNFRPANIAPVLPSGGGVASNIRVGLQPFYFQPNLGATGSGLGAINLNLGQRQIPDLGGRFALGGAHYSLSGNIYTVPIYATPSRVLFNTEFGFGTYWSPYSYYW